MSELEKTLSEGISSDDKPDNEFGEISRYLAWVKHYNALLDSVLPEKVSAKHKISKAEARLIRREYSKEFGMLDSIFSQLEKADYSWTRDPELMNYMQKQKDTRKIQSRIKSIVREANIGYAMATASNGIGDITETVVGYLKTKLRL